MPEQQTGTPPPAPQGLEEFEHPRGTLLIVIIFGALFALGWLGMYFFLFMQRGAPHH